MCAQQNNMYNYQCRPPPVQSDASLYINLVLVQITADDVIIPHSKATMHCPWTCVARIHAHMARPESCSQPCLFQSLALIICDLRYSR